MLEVADVVGLFMPVLLNDVAGDHANVVPPAAAEAVIVVGASAEHLVGAGEVTVTVGVATLVTLKVAIDEQLPLDPVTVYTVLEPGFASSVFVVAPPGDHE